MPEYLAVKSQRGNECVVELNDMQVFKTPGLRCDIHLTRSGDRARRILQGQEYGRPVQ
jgi:hypothetical protein